MGGHGALKVVITRYALCTGPCLHPSHNIPDPMKWHEDYDVMVVGSAVVAIMLFLLWASFCVPVQPQ